MLKKKLKKNFHLKKIFVSKVTFLISHLFLRFLIKIYDFIESREQLRR